MRYSGRQHLFSSVVCHNFPGLAAPLYQPLGGSPGSQLEKRFQLTMKASLFVLVSKFQPIGSAPKTVNDISAEDWGRMSCDFDSPVLSARIVMVVPSTFRLLIWKCIACPPCTLRCDEPLQEPLEWRRFPSASVSAIKSPSAYCDPGLPGVRIISDHTVIYGPDSAGFSFFIADDSPAINTAPRTIHANHQRNATW
jgi:hypothetical protein